VIPLVGNNMKSIESILFEDYQVEPAALMEVAGRSVAEQVVSLANPKTVGVVAGKGNNGGDALTCARFLLDRGINVKVFSLESSVRLTYLLDEGAVVCKDIKQLQDCDVLVDGLFGYGFRPPAGEAYATLINEMNALSLPVVSIDMPSGLPAEGMVEEPIVQAELTVFLGLPKVNAVTGMGLMRSGRFVLDGLGYGRFFESHAESLAYSIESTDAGKIMASGIAMPYHKREAGLVSVVAGSEHFPGAALLVVKTLLLMGAGLVYIKSDQHVEELVISEFPQVVRGDGPGAKVIGPGLEDVSLALSMAATDFPKVIDAGGLRSEVLEHAKNAVITPHEGEAARLLNTSVEEVRRNRYDAAKRLYERFGHVVLLKGPGTIIYDGQRWLVIPINEPRLATGGTGDVLSGLIGFFLSRGMTLADAAVSAAYLHAKCASEFSTGLNLNKFIERIAESWWAHYDR